MNRVALFTLITLLASLGCSKPQKPVLPPPPAPPPEEEPAVREPAAPKRDIIRLLEIEADDRVAKCDQALKKVRLATWQPRNKEYAEKLGQCIVRDFDLYEIASDLAREGAIPPEDMPRLAELRAKISVRILYLAAFKRCLHKFNDDKGLLNCMATEGKKIRKGTSTALKTI